MSYCTVVCEVRFFFTYRRNVHVLLYCFVKFGSSLPTEETLMCYCTVFCEVRFLFTYGRNAHVLLYCGLWSSVLLYLVPSVCEVQFLFAHCGNAHVLLYCVFWNSVPLYIQKERSCIIVLCFVRFGSSLSKEGTLLSDCTVFCEVRFLFTYRTNDHVSVPTVGKEELNFTNHSTIRHECSFCR
jgi:hypothetical protein